ncbi:MAG: hypothetical protein WC714_28385 [Candidatus Obscuribacterales bacterium]|jgi:hypothetical protein
MATPQASVNYGLPVGIPGEVAYDITPHVQQRLIDSDGQANVFGYAYTESTTGIAKVGGTGQFAGILLSPKTQSSAGGTTGSLSTTFALLDNTYASLGRFGAFFVAAPAAANIGDQVLFDNTTGALSTQPTLAQFTAAQSTTVLTVSAVTAGTGAIGIGSEIKLSGAIIGTVISLGTGTGGTGTYNLNTSATVGSAAMTADSNVPVGKQRVPNAKVDYFNLTAAGTAVIKIIGA